MRNAFLILFISVFQAYALDSYSQNTKLTLTLNNVPIANVLEKIEDNSEFYFLYNAKLIDVKRKISIIVENEEISNILSTLFSGTGVNYKVFDRRIVLSPGEMTSLPETVQQQLKITGTVTEKDGKPLPGVSIVIKGTTQGTVTDANGNYSISNISSDATLVFSFVGMRTQEVTIAGKTIINIALDEKMIGIDEVVAVGYGAQKRANVTGSVATVSGEELTESHISNIENVILGRLPGVTGMNPNGRPGSGSILQIRGLSTLNDNSPLVVIDGIVRDNFSSIDPNDIQNLTILKDASSTSVYGARAANGVFLITTKKGTTGKPKISYSGTVGFQQPTNYPKTMNAYEFATGTNQAYINMGYDPSNPTHASRFYSDEEIEHFKTTSTDWYKETFKEKSVQTQHNLSVNGGTESIKYYSSLGYLSEDGMYDNISFEKTNIRTNVEARINKTLNLNINLEAIQRVNKNPYFDSNFIFRTILYSVKPTIPAFNQDGSLRNTGGEHPIGMIKDSGYNNNKDNFFQGILSFDQDLTFLIPGLSLKGTYSTGRNFSFQKVFNTPYYMYDLDPDGNVIYKKQGYLGTTSLREVYTHSNFSTMNASLNYMRTFNKHNISALLLFEQYGSQGNTASAYKNDFETNIKDQFFASGPGNQNIDGWQFINDRRRGMVGRLNYNYLEKYLVEGSFRYDGSFRFPKNERFGFFPAFSLGWRISEEAFFKNVAWTKFIDNLKIRLSKGVIGNDRVGAFQFDDNYTIQTNTGPVFDGNPYPIINYGVYPNQSITWEKQNNNNIGLESSFWNSKLGFEFDYFYRVTKDILWSKSRSIPETFGRSLPSSNYAEVKSNGFEFTITHKNKISDISYSFRLTGSYNKNKVTRIDDPSDALDFTRQLGRPIGFKYGYEALGIFQSQEEADNWCGGYQFGQKSLAGDIKYADLSKDGLISTVDQKVLSNYSHIPRIVYGFVGDFKWKNFNLNFLIQGTGQSTIMLEGNGRVMFTAGFNSFSYLKDSWSPNNKDAKYPLAWVSSRSINDRNSNFWLMNTSYVRLKSVELGYSFNTKWLKKQNIEDLRLFVSGYNLLTWSKLKEFDPEAESGTGSYYPQQRLISAGINFSF
ncbi:MAG: TonB-dependent receptor [Mangrovibacterium sp.]